MTITDRWFISMWMCTVIHSNARYGSALWVVSFAGMFVCGLCFIFTDNKQTKRN
jgi:hypothetical protein